MTPPTYAGFLLDLFLAAILGGAIGLQRQASHKPAGFRTHLLVAVGSCAFMEVSRLFGDDRFVANVITGIGFLGAGAIVRDGAIPRGLTTAASIWAVAAIGTALGFGTPLAYALAALTTLLVFLALSFTDKRLRGVLPYREELDVEVTFDLRAIDFEHVVRLFDGERIRAKATARVSIDASADLLATLHILVRAKHHAHILEKLADVAKTRGIKRIAADEAGQP